MAYWLIKSEPETWSWDQQKAEGRKGAEWDGVRNFQARSNMRAMSKGDLAFFYHSGDDKGVVGIVKVVKEAHPDSTDARPMGVRRRGRGARPAAAPSRSPRSRRAELKDMVLVRNSRLSVQPVT